MKDDSRATRNEQVTAPPSAQVPAGWRPGPFEHERLDAFVIARRALCEGERVARRLPRGYATLADQLRRALLAAYLGVAEAASRTGADRVARFRCARGEAAEAAAALEAVLALGLAAAAQVQPVRDLLARLCAMLTRLSRPAG
jgi:four helix bundle protein